MPAKLKLNPLIGKPRVDITKGIAKGAAAAGLVRGLATPATPAIPTGPITAPTRPVVAPNLRRGTAGVAAGLAQARANRAEEPLNLAGEAFNPSNLLEAAKKIGRGLADGFLGVFRRGQAEDLPGGAGGADDVDSDVSSLAQRLAAFIQKTGRSVKDIMTKPIEYEAAQLEKFNIDPLEEYKKAMITYEGRRWIRINEPEIYDRLIEEGY